VSIPVTDLADVTRVAGTRLQHEVHTVLGDDVLAVWVDGGSTFPDRPRHRTSDVDMCIVVAPTRAELERALDRELEHLERHVYEGDAADPYEATYAVWNGCRILYTLATGSPVISMRSAGDWALVHLPEERHAAIRAAGRAYDDDASAADDALLARTMAPFVAMVRERLPVTGPRPPGPPRWS